MRYIRNDTIFSNYSFVVPKRSQRVIGRYESQLDNTSLSSSNYGENSVDTKSFGITQKTKSLARSNNYPVSSIGNYSKPSFYLPSKIDGHDNNHIKDTSKIKLSNKKNHVVFDNDNIKKVMNKNLFDICRKSILKNKKNCHDDTKNILQIQLLKQFQCPKLCSPTYKTSSSRKQEILIKNYNALLNIKNLQLLVRTHSINALYSIINYQNFV